MFSEMTSGMCGLTSETLGLNPCELQDPVWASKMNNLSGVIKPKRKKSENKPQTQINKCNNEKRRREQENTYIEELAELISVNYQDMSSLSVKPDKCAILQETVNQIRRIKQQEAANQSNLDPVQQGEVSSSKPSIVTKELWGPLLLEALEGFLFVVNYDAKVEYVSDNVPSFIKFTNDELVGKSIYNFIHPGDHNKFTDLLPMTIEWTGGGTASDQSTSTRSKSLDVRFLIKNDDEDDLDESVEEKTGQTSYYESMHISSTQLREQQFTGTEDGGKNSDSNCVGPCTLCVASRICYRDKISYTLQQFTTKLDRSGKITCVDTSSVSESIAQVLRKDFKDRMLHDFVPSPDLRKLNTHFQETLAKGSSVSEKYYIQLTSDKFLHVQTKSKLFKSYQHTNSDTDFIMATHSIMGDNETLGTADPGGGGGGSSSGGGSNGNGTSRNTSIGGPLMTSIVNGSSLPSSVLLLRNGGGTSSSALDRSLSTNLSSPASSVSMGGSILSPPVPPAPPPSTASTLSSSYTPGYLDNDFNIDFPTTTWSDLDVTDWSTDTSCSRTPRSVDPQQQHIVCLPASTVSLPPPSNQLQYSNSTTITTSPISAISFSSASTQQHHDVNKSQQPSNHTLNNNNNNNNSFNPFNISLENFTDQNCCYSVDENEEKNTKIINVLDDPPGATIADSHRLRNLLTNPPTAASSSNNSNAPQQDETRDKILKELLNQQDDDQNNRSNNNNNNRSSSRAPLLSSNNNSNRVTQGGGSGVQQDPSKTANSSASAGSSTGNNMLRQLLKNDEDDMDVKKGMKKNSELLQQLLKKGTTDDDDDIVKNEKSSSTDETLLKVLGFPGDNTNCNTRRGTKRSSDEMLENKNKRLSTDGAQVTTSTESSLSTSSSQSSELCKKNRMLAFLLAKETPSAASIPPIPDSVITATPQEKLPKVYSDTQKIQSTNQSNNNNNNNNNGSSNVGKSNQVGRSIGGRPSSLQHSNYLSNDLLRHPNQISDVYNISATSSGNIVLSDNHNWGENNNIIEGHLKEEDIAQLLKDIEDITKENQNLSETREVLMPTNLVGTNDAINKIEHSLRQCESLLFNCPTTTTTSSNISICAVRPSTYGSLTVTSTNTYPPPPNYHQAKYQRALSLPTNGGRFATIGGASSTTQQHILLAQQQRRLQQQQQEKQRLLQQQKQQQLLIPSSATAAEANQSIQNIDTLLNTSVAPNVSLQRSNSVTVSETPSQLSPKYGNQMQGTVNPSGQRTSTIPQPSQHQQQPPYSPPTQLTGSPLNQANFQAQTSANNYNQAAAALRLSPQSQYNSAAAAAAAAAQLSPRQKFAVAQSNNSSTTTSSNNNMNNNNNGSGGGGGGTTATNWAQQRINVQQNPMLSAQLLGNVTGPYGFQKPLSHQSPQQQQQRTHNSPGSRQSQYSGGGGGGPTGGGGGGPNEQFNAPPTSPSNTSTYNHQQQQYLQRLQRTNSVPSTTNATALSGGLGSPRAYPNIQSSGGNQAVGPPPPPPQTPSHYPSMSSPMLYQQQQDSSPYNCYDQPQLGLGYERRTGGVSTPHLQPGPSSEFVRQELRAVVGARTARPPPVLGGGGQPPGLQQSSIGQQSVDLDSLEMGFEMASGASESPKLWGAMGSDIVVVGSMSPPPQSTTTRITMEDGRQGDKSSSLLQKLLSDHTK